MEFQHSRWLPIIIFNLFSFKQWGCLGGAVRRTGMERAARLDALACNASSARWHSIKRREKRSLLRTAAQLNKKKKFKKREWIKTDFIYNYR